jgi:acyl carrier protein
VQTKLPTYMVPSAIVLLTSLPLASNGKVDRMSLPAPDTVPSGLDYVAPRNGIESQVAHLWEDLLGVRPISATADFFELGGHSLLASRLLVRVRERFHVDVSMRAFFAVPTVAGLGAAIVEQLANRADAGAVASVFDELRGLSDEDARRRLRDAGG